LGETAVAQRGNFADLTAAVAALRSGKSTSAELVEAALARIEAFNPRIGAMTEVLERTARAEARRADRARGAGKPLSELAGVPVVIKDIIDTTPAVCSAGLLFLGDYRPATDATVVRRLRRSRAVIVGVSASDPGAFGVRTEKVTHPQAPGRTVGGSSGGSGAALAAGFGFAALGTDTGGSIRIPAACCQIAGLKPTLGRISTKGIRPLVWSLDHVGPMTRKARDLAIVARILDPRFDRSARRPARRRLAIGHAPGYSADADPEVGEGLVRALEACRALGHEIVEVALPHPDETLDVHGKIFCAEAAAYHFATFPGRLGDYAGTARQLLELAKEHKGYEYVSASRLRVEFRRQVQELFTRIDFLIVPTLPVLTPRVDAPSVVVGGVERDFTLALVRYTALFDHTGNPVVSLPVTVLSPGIGTSVQIVGPYHRDADVVALAARLERMLDLSIDFSIRT
jgi:Asp-tRNA(Asn)/Glu-tRNA(Gln) amidotransferase A subunit family amidase